jgi:hypothetical protein
LKAIAAACQAARLPFPVCTRTIASYEEQPT